MNIDKYNEIKNSYRSIINQLIKSQRTIEKKSKELIDHPITINLPKDYVDCEISFLTDTVYSICIFDLDNTLVETDIFETDREKSRNNCLELDKFIQKLSSSRYKIFFTEQFLLELRQSNPNVKFVIFTRSTSQYAKAILSYIYPNFIWDLIVTRETVRYTKPNIDGLHFIMKSFNEMDPRRLLIIGDSDVDIKVAYNNNSISLFTDWFYLNRKKEHWHAKNLLPDGIITKPEELIEVLKSGVTLPNLEANLEVGLRETKKSNTRFDMVSHFFPIDLDSSYARKPVSISVGGRYFTSAYISRGSYHKLTRSILSNKDSQLFPHEWLVSIRDFIVEKLNQKPNKTIVTVIPHRPSREPRLEYMLDQLCNFVKNEAIHEEVFFYKDILKFKDGVLSQHNDRLNKNQRFQNIETHLYVNRPDLVKNMDVIVIDDVVTTGASLMYSSLFLKQAGANNVFLFALAKTISK